MKSWNSSKTYLDDTHWLGDVITSCFRMEIMKMLGDYRDQTVKHEIENDHVSLFFCVIRSSSGCRACTSRHLKTNTTSSRFFFPYSIFISDKFAKPSFSYSERHKIRDCTLKMEYAILMAKNIYFFVREKQETIVFISG